MMLKPDEKQTRFKTFDAFKMRQKSYFYPALTRTDNMVFYEFNKDFKGFVKKKTSFHLVCIHDKIMAVC